MANVSKTPSFIGKTQLSIFRRKCHETRRKTGRPLAHRNPKLCMQVTFTFSRQNVSFQWIKEETSGTTTLIRDSIFPALPITSMVAKTVVNIIPEISITPGATSLQKQHHSRNDITPEATLLKKQHYSRGNITPNASLLQKQHDVTPEAT